MIPEFEIQAQEEKNKKKKTKPQKLIEGQKTNIINKKGENKAEKSTESGHEFGENVRKKGGKRAKNE